MAVKPVDVVPGGSLPGTWSASAADAVTQCGLKFWFARVAGWREPPQQHLAVGNLVHSTLESFYSLPADDRDPRMIVELVDQHLTEVLGDPEVLDAAAVRDAALTCLRVWWDREKRPDLVVIEPDGLERELRTTLDGVPFVGYVDRIERARGLWRVVDYKTGKAKPEYMESKWRQQMLYAAAMAQLDQPVDEVALLFLGDDRAVLTVRPVYDAAVERAVAHLLTAVSEATNSLDTGAWAAKSSPLCRFCPFKPACPAHGERPQPGTAASEAVLTRAGLAKRERRRETPVEARSDEASVEGLS